MSRKHSEGYPGSEWCGACGQEWPCQVERLTADLAAIRGELEGIREMVGALEDETTVDAVRDMAAEWRHYSKEMNTAGYVTIPTLKADLDAARAEARALRAAIEVELRIDEQEIRSRCSEMPTRRADWYVAESIRGKRLRAALATLSQRSASEKKTDAAEPPLPPPSDIAAAMDVLCACDHRRRDHGDGQDWCEYCSCPGFRPPPVRQPEGDGTTAASGEDRA
jgi:hypothetical protein